MFDKLINRIGVSLALVLMICELTYVNAKSLLFLTSETAPIDQAMSVIGSLAFSMVTVVVMRKAGTGWFKIVFPVFDAALVFLGFNLHHAQSIINGSDNPVRLYLSVFLAVFTGIITYSLGLINHRDHASDSSEFKTDPQAPQSNIADSATELMCEVESLLSDFEKAKSENASLQTHINSLESDIKALHTEIEDRDTDHNSLKHQLVDTQKQLVKYRDAYLRAEVSRIRKKKPENCTPDELEILRLMDTN